MKRITVCLGVTLALSLQHSLAALLIQESFNYSTGNIIAQTVNGAGLNGSSTWTKAAGSGTSFTVQASSLSFAGHFASSGGSLLVSNPSGPYADDSASATVSATLTGYSTLYASSIMTMNTAGTYYNDWAIEQRFNSSATGIWSSSSGRNIVSAFGSGSSASRKGGVSTDSSETTQATGSLAAGTKYLLVTKYTVSGANITSATLYVFSEAAYATYLANSTAGTAEPNLASYALFSLTDSATVALSNFGFLQFAIGGGPSGQVDEFRLGSAITDVVNVNSGSAPTISGLVNQTVVASNNVSLNPTVTGSAPIAYQWRQNGVNLGGETNSVLTLLNVQTNQNGYVYSLVATNANGAATNSMILTVLASAPSVQLTLNLDVNKYSQDAYSGTAAAPDAGTSWNQFTVPAASTYTLANVMDSAGNVTSNSITFSRASNFSVWANASSVGNPNPSLLMRDYLYGGGYTVTVSNLPFGTYTLYAYAHGDGTGQASTVTVDAANGGASGSTTDTGEFLNIYQVGALGNSYLALSGTVGGAGTFTFTTAYLNGFQLQYITAPAISALTNQTVIAGQSTVLFPVVTGTPPLSFQWRSNNIALAGQTNASLVLNNVQYSQNGAQYSLVASNPAGAATNSMVLTVIVTPSITGLNNQAVAPGSTVTMAPTVSGVPAPALQWLYNGSLLADGATGNGSTISGSTTSTLGINNAQIADGGTYSLVASNSAGIVTNSMSLLVSATNVPPQITGPVNQTVVQGSNATFSASATGLPIPALQWRVNGTNIAGATNSSLTVSNVQYAQNGYVYSLVASNSEGAVTNNASLIVLVPPAITQQPTNLAVIINTPATFSVAGSGVPAVKYQWRKNGSPIANATNASYTISSAQGSDNGATFSVVVSNSVAVVTSSNATLTVLSTMAGAFLPTNNATGISPDQQLRIVFSGGTPKLGAGKLHVRNAADDSIFASIDTSQFITFTFDGATVTNGANRNLQGINCYYEPIAIEGNVAWVTFTNRFAYNKTYYVTADAGLFRDGVNASFPAISGTNMWRFSTKTSGPATPTASTGPTNITVGLDGAGDFATLQGASDWIPQNNTLRRNISIQPGTYRDYALFEQNRNTVTISGAGASPEDVLLYYPWPTGGSGIGVLTLDSSDINVLNLDLDTKAYLTFPGRMRSLITTGNRLVFENVLIKGGQDTLYTVSGSAYFKNCEVWGSVDFIYGGAVAVFDQCAIVEVRDTGGPITAPNTPYAQPYGLVFLNCSFPQATIAAGHPYNVGTGNTTFQRPWGNDGATAVINCQLGNQFSTKGWAEWGDRENTCRDREYGSTMIGGGAAPTVAARQAAGAYWLNTIDPDYTNNPSLNPANALLALPNGPTNRVGVTVNPADYTLDAIFGHPYFGLGSWRPAVLPLITSHPTHQTVNVSAPASFSVMAIGVPEPVYQWLKNGTNLLGQTNATLTFASVQASDVGTYSVVVSNSVGSVTSSNALLQLNGTSAPVFTTQPTNQSASVGSSVNFVAAAIGVPTPVYQWLRNGTNLVGATNATLTLTNVQVVDSGVYSVIASNSVSAVSSMNATLTVDGPNGFCMINGTTTGGAGGTVVTVTNASDFATQIGMAGPRIIQVSGVLTVGDTWTASDKTIIGLGTNATLLGRISVSGVTNVIIRNLRFTNPGNDGISIRDPGTHHIWVDHCTFFDCGDGSCDVSQEADYVTVSWCKFIYPTQLEHRFVMIASGISNAPTHVTVHHNWFGLRADQRMTASGDAFIHTYNNYYNCTNNSYCQNSGTRAEILSENNYASGVDDPIGYSPGTDGKIKTSGNINVGCTGNQGPYNDVVFTPPYGYLLDAAANVPAIVQAGAGAPGPETMPIPPKVWDGGGANNNLNTVNNWGFNEAPRKFDTLLFAGSTRLTPNNDFTANTEFRSLMFSNNAGAFVVGGNPIKLGAGISNASPNVQTINLNFDLSFGLDRYSTERRFEVSDPSGSLVINGSIVGDTNGYTRPYAVFKTGPGLLALSGPGFATLGGSSNDFFGTLNFNGGLVRFNNLTNLGTADLAFDGGGLQWATGNAADISGKSLAINPGGATFDVGANNVAFANPVGVGDAGGITKAGTGKLTLNGNNTFAGNTLITQGTLALGAAGALPNSPQIILTNSAVLDVSGRSDGTLSLGAGKKLTGTGTVRGSVTVGSGSTVAPGFSLGTLVITNVLTFQSGSTNVMELDAASHTNDLITGMVSVNYGGRLIVTNLGGSLGAGDSFKLFSAASYNGAFSSIVWPALNGSLYWTNKLAVDGTIAVVSPVNTTPTNIVVTVTGNQIQLSWPADRIGWRLEAQTNNLSVGLNTNWTSLGYESTNAVSLPISSANGSVFYRLVYP
jgi:autotransporter-associated beta strand protein